MKRSLPAIISFLFSVLSSYAQQKNELHAVNTFHIASAGGWDYLALSPVNDWLYISHGTKVNILHKTTGDSVGIIDNTEGVHGIAFDVFTQKGFTSNGKSNSVTVFDLQTNKVLAQIATGQNPDAILYDSFSKKIITCNGRSKNLSIIDPIQNKTIDSVFLGGKPETAVSDGKGKLFVNIEDKNEIVIVDTKENKVLNHWNLGGGEGPTGLAYDQKTKRLFIGCDKLLIVMNATNGKIIAQLPIGEGCDGVVFDEKMNTVFTANGEGTISIIHEGKHDEFKEVGNFATKKGARTIALDSDTHLLYLPVADFEKVLPDQKGRPKMLSGTFQILVIGS